MKVVFRVGASLQIGIGHVMRCLTLAEILKENGANIEFICRKHEGNLIDKIRVNGFTVFGLELSVENKVDNKLFHSHWLGTTQQEDARDCANILRQTKVDWLIVDHYGIDEDWQQDLKDYYDKLMVIDDLADRQHQCNILLDQTFGRQSKDYHALVPKSCELLLGSQYALLRPEFAKWREYSLERRKHPEFKQLLINMGGIDPDNFTEQVLNEIQACSLPNDVEITIVMGGLSPHLESVKNKANSLSCKAEIKVDVDNIAEIMANSDFAIGAAGSTTWERCCLGLPSLLIVQAENQKTIAKYMELNKAALIVKIISNLGWIFKSSFIKGDTELFNKITDSSSNIIDGIGAIRVLNKFY